MCDTTKKLDALKKQVLQYIKKLSELSAVYKAFYAVCKMPNKTELQKQKRKTNESLFYNSLYDQATKIADYYKQNTCITFAGKLKASDGEDLNKLLESYSTEYKLPERVPEPDGTAFEKLVTTEANRFFATDGKMQKEIKTAAFNNINQMCVKNILTPLFKQAE